MSRRLTYGMIRDGLVVGALERTLIHCECCGEVCCGVRLTTITLPERIEVESTILWDRSREHLVAYLGLGCGCYAKFHRQVAHIQDRMARK